MIDAWAALLFGGLMILMSAYMVVGVLLTYLKLSQVQAWQTTPGVIVQSKIAKDIETSNYVYRNDIAYEYQVGGQRLRGDKVTPFFLNTDQSGRSAKVAQRYPVGREVKVYYNPAKPQDSLLEPTGLRWVGVLVAAVSLAAMLFGWVFVREALPVLFGQ